MLDVSVVILVDVVEVELDVLVVTITTGIITTRANTVSKIMIPATIHDRFILFLENDQMKN